MENFGFSMLWYWVAYILVTLVGMLHTIFNIYVRKMSPMDAHSMGEGYEKTKPWHPLYNIIIFPIFAWIYFQGLPTVSIMNVAWTSLLWGSITVVFDVFGWVLIKHPWALTFKQFYIEYQPWITLIYLAIYTSPWLSYGIMVISI